MATNNLVSSFRRVNAIPEGAAHDTVVQALRDHDKGLLDLQTAIPLLKSQIDALKAGSTTAATTTISGGSASTGGASSAFPNGIGTLNNKSGTTSYSTQTTDNSAWLIFSDASPVAVALNTALQPPWFCYALNWGAGTVTFTPPPPSTINYFNNLGATWLSLTTGSIAMINFDGSNFWAGVIAPSSGGTISEITSSTLAVTDPTGPTVDIEIAATGVTPGSYTSTNLTVNAEGQITAASNGSSSGILTGTVTVAASGTSGTFKGSATLTGAVVGSAVAASAPGLIGLCGTSQVSWVADVATGGGEVEVQVTLPNIGPSWGNIVFYVAVLPT